MRTLPARRSTLVALLLAAAPAVAHAQVLATADLAVGVGSNAQRVSVAAWRPVTDVLGLVSLRAGLRATSYSGSGGTFDNRDPVTVALPATLPFAPAATGINLAVELEAAPPGPFTVGANLDLAGFAFGPTVTAGSFRAGLQSTSLFLGGRNDRGALNSEFYAGWHVLPLLTLRAGVSHSVTTYDVTAPGGTSARYQQFVTVPFVAVRLAF